MVNKTDLVIIFQDLYLPLYSPSHNIRAIFCLSSPDYNWLISISISQGTKETEEEDFMN